MQQKSCEFPRRHFDFRKLNIPSLPKRQQWNNLSQHRIQSSTVHNQPAAKINRIKTITVIGKRRNIQELSHAMQWGTNESRV